MDQILSITAYLSAIVGTRNLWVIKFVKNVLLKVTVHFVWLIMIQHNVQLAFLLVHTIPICKS